MFNGMYNGKINWIRVTAEAFGILALAFCMIMYLWAMGSYWISGVGIFLMPITVGGYVGFTQASRKSLSEKGVKSYWIMYAA